MQRIQSVVGSWCVRLEVSTAEEGFLVVQFLKKTGYGAIIPPRRIPRRVVKSTGAAKWDTAAMRDLRVSEAAKTEARKLINSIPA